MTMTILAILATISGIVASLGLFPQALKIFKRKSAKDLSILTFSLGIVNNSLWVLYGFELKNWPIIISNAVAVVNLAIVIFGWILYGRETK